jgi:hypothetical protein
MSGTLGDIRLICKDLRGVPTPHCTDLSGCVTPPGLTVNQPSSDFEGSSPSSPTNPLRVPRLRRNQASSAITAITVVRQRRRANRRNPPRAAPKRRQPVRILIGDFERHFRIRLFRQIKRRDRIAPVAPQHLHSLVQALRAPCCKALRA